MVGAHGRGVLVMRSWHDAERESVVLEINDDGPGIPPDVQPKIFDPFFTTKDVGKGTGLGLTVAYAIVQEHGGRIRLESQAGSGTSFYVELPVVGGRLPRRSRAGMPAAQTAAGAAILLVEDEAALASVVTECLKDAGYIVEHAADGEEALTKFDEQLFDLVICDLKMPRLDGRAFYQRLADRGRDFTKRMIFVTGDVAGTDAESFLEETGCRWLAKPFRLADLLRSVRDSLA
jgi:CheY-like chemotaxis protein